MNASSMYKQGATSPNYVEFGCHKCNTFTFYRIYRGNKHISRPLLLMPIQTVSMTCNWICHGISVFFVACVCALEYERKTDRCHYSSLLVTIISHELPIIHNECIKQDMKLQRSMPINGLNLYRNCQHINNTVTDILIASPFGVMGY